MKFKILEIEQKGNNLQVVISHKECNRQVFSFPIELAENNQFLEEIKRILYEREEVKKVNIDKLSIGKEFDSGDLKKEVAIKKRK